MPKLTQLVFAFFILAMSNAMPSLAADFTVDSWLVGIGVFGDTQATGALAGTPNPFLQSHSRMLGSSVAMATYQFSWGSQAKFLIESMLTTESVDDEIYASSASGQIEFTSNKELTLVTTGRFERNLPADQMSVRYSFRVINLDQQSVIGGAAFSHNTINGLGFGEFVIDNEQLVFHAGRYLLTYLMEVYAAPSSAGHIGTGHSFIEFRIIPEPASALIVFVAAGLLFIKRSRHIM